MLNEIQWKLDYQINRRKNVVVVSTFSMCWLFICVCVFVWYNQNNTHHHVPYGLRNLMTFCAWFTSTPNPGLDYWGQYSKFQSFFLNYLQNKDNIGFEKLHYHKNIKEKLMINCKQMPRCCCKNVFNQMLFQTYE